jgi:hypothetical protein
LHCLTPQYPQYFSLQLQVDVFLSHKILVSCLLLLKINQEKTTKEKEKALAPAINNRLKSIYIK